MLWNAPLLSDKKVKSLVKDKLLNVRLIFLGQVGRDNAFIPDTESKFFLKLAQLLHLH